MYVVTSFWGIPPKTSYYFITNQQTFQKISMQNFKIKEITS